MALINRDSNPDGSVAGIVSPLYQIHVQSCDGQEVSAWLQKLGIPGSPMDHSFVVSVLPLFLVYLATLVQSSIKSRDGEWMFVNEGRPFLSSRRALDLEGQTHYATLKERLCKVGQLTRDAMVTVRRGLSWYWPALGSGSEAPPHFVQVSLQVGKWPEDGIQPVRIESQFNRLLAAVNQEALPGVRRPVDSATGRELCSRVRLESIEDSTDNNHSMALAVLEIIYAAPPQGYALGRDHQTLTPTADVAAELQKAKDEGQLEETGLAHAGQGPVIILASTNTASFNFGWASSLVALHIQVRKQFDKIQDSIRSSGSFMSEDNDRLEFMLEDAKGHLQSLLDQGKFLNIGSWQADKNKLMHNVPRLRQRLLLVRHQLSDLCEGIECLSGNLIYGHGYLAQI